MRSHLGHSRFRAKGVIRHWISQFGAFCFAGILTLASGLSGSSPAHGSQRMSGGGDASSGVLATGGSERGIETPEGRRSNSQVRRTRNSQLVVEPGIVEQLAAGDSVDIVIHFGNLPDFEPFYKMDWRTRGRALYDTMQAIVLATQGPVMEELRTRGVRFRSHWVGNNMEVHGVDSAIFAEIVSFDSVHSVVFNPKHFLIEPEGPPTDVSAMVLGGGTIEPNLSWVGAPDVWAQGIRGQGVVVGLNDASPRFTHNSLVGAYRGNQGGGIFDHQYNWFDPNTGSAMPFPESHGTHVLGLMVGDDGVRSTGIAPDAQWIACGGCAGGSCAGVLTCLNWFAAPTDQSGANPDPDLRPQVVNNSWGNCLTTYQDTVYEPIWDTLYAAGVMPFFANGNASNCDLPNHPGLNTVGNPARAGRVIGVGSTAQTGGAYASHSLWGPTDDPNPGTPASFDHFGFPQVKPNVVAPGQGVVAASATSDTGYVANTGTSMATPHVTGFAALLISACPILQGDHQTMGTIMMSTADHRPYDGGSSGDNPDVEPGVNHPNFGTGWGEINVVNAVAAAQALCGPIGTLSGTVIDADTMQTLQGAHVAIPNSNPPPENFNTNTSAGGTYSRVLPEGSYQITFSKFGYLSQTEDVVIAEDAETVLDIALEPAELVLVSGRISDIQTGWGLHAEISFSGVPVDSVFSNPISGEYSVNLPEQGEFNVTVRALVPGYLPEHTTLSAMTPETVQDVALQADEIACAAPGYEAVATMFEGFESDVFPPVGWTAVKTAGNGNPARNWNRTTTDSNSGAASAFRNWNAAADGNQIDWLITPQLDFSEFDTLSFFERTGFPAFYALNEVLISEASCDPLDGQFEVLQEVQGDNTWRFIELDLGAYTGAGCLAFRYEGQDAHSWYIDDVRLTSPESQCVAPPGALLFGHVIDANTTIGLNGATVEIEGHGSLTTMASPDPSYGSGIFYAYLNAGPLGTLIFADGFESPKAPDAKHLSGLNGPQIWTVRAELEPYYPDEDTVEALPGGNSGVLLALTAGRLSVEPSALVQSTEFMQTSNRNLALINDGTAPVAFEVEVDTSVVPVVSADFEGLVPPDGWTVTSLGGAAPCVWRRNDDLMAQNGAPALPRANFAGGEGFSAAADSDRCGNGSSMDSELVSPIIDFSALEDPRLEFVMSFRALADSRLDLDISTNGGGIWTTIESWTGADVSATGPGTPRSYSLAAYAGSSEGRLRFRYVAPGWHWWAQIDQVRVGGQAQWLSVTPGIGTFETPTDASGQLLNVHFDATQVPGPGTYAGMIRIANDTPYNGLVEVPVTFNVTPAPGQSRLQGRVSGLGYCDADSYPAAGASITVIGQHNTFGVSADENGDYGLWIDTSEAPVTVEVAAADHVSQSADEVALVSQQTTTRNFNLRLEAPCGSVSPSSVSTSQDPNTTTIVQVILRNEGAAQLDWSEGVGSQSVLVLEQVDNANNGIVSSRFLGLNPTTGAYSADDFEFSGGGIRSIRVDGLRSGGGSIALTATDLGFYIYPDAGGAPAGHPEDGGGSESWSFVAAPNHPAFSIGMDSRITLDVVLADGQPASLAPGHYWVVAYATVPGTEGSVRWNWYAAAPGEATGFDAQIITPGEAFGGVFPAWASIAGSVDPVFAGLGLRVDAEFNCSSIANTVVGSDSVEADGVMILDIAVDTTGVAPGNYSETVCLLTNDAQAELIAVVVDLEVLTPASFGTLQGTVTSSGYCDLESIPLQGANVEVVGQTFTFDVVTAANGVYSIAVDSLDGPYTVTATASDHLSGQAAGIDVSAGGISVEDVVLRLDAPCVSTAPNSLSASVAAGASTEVDLDIFNAGAGSLMWNIALDAQVAMLGEPEPVEVVEDGGFESGTPNAFWGESSTNFGTPLCTTAVCGFGGGTGPRSGDWWAWFGGISATEVGVVAQNVTIPPATSAELRFWLEIPVVGGSGTLEVRLGDDLVFTANQDDAGSFGTYSEVVVDVLAYADGSERELRFTGSTSGGTSNLFIDDVSLAVQPGGLCVAPEGVPWLSADPVAGTIDGDASDTVSITFDASALAEGGYEATLCLGTSDVENPLIVIPIEFEVTEEITPP